MAQYIKRIMGVLLLVGIVTALYFGITEEQVPPKISWGATELASGRWTQTEDAVVFAASLDAVSANEPMMFLQSQWRNYSVLWMTLWFTPHPEQKREPSICSDCRRERH